MTFPIPILPTKMFIFIPICPTQVLMNFRTWVWTTFWSLRGRWSCESWNTSNWLHIRGLYFHEVSSLIENNGNHITWFLKLVLDILPCAVLWLWTRLWRWIRGLMWRWGRLKKMSEGWRKTWSSWGMSWERRGKLVVDWVIKLASSIPWLRRCVDIWVYHKPLKREQWQGLSWSWERLNKGGNWMRWSQWTVSVSGRHDLLPSWHLVAGRCDELLELIL